MATPLELAVSDATAKRVSLQLALDASLAAGQALAVECLKVPDPDIPGFLGLADIAKKNMLASLTAVDNNLAKAAKEALAYVAPPPPPPPPPPPTTTPSVYGCPAGTALKLWQFAMVTGGGRPAGVPPWSKGARISGVHFKGIESKAWYSEIGICTGQTGFSEDIELRDSIVGPAAKWHARVKKVKGTRVINVSDMGGPEEHDWYIEPIGGQPMTEACFLLKNGYSERCGSQRLQSAQRSEDGVTDAMYVDGGMIVVKHDKCVDHARHQSEGGTGTRCSQAYKVFSAQVGPDEAHRVNRLLKHWVLFDDIDLDDSMQKLSHGFGLIGAVAGAAITNCKARMGSLTHPTTSIEAIRVESFLPGSDGSTGVGPLLIEGCHFEATSGPTGPGIALLDKRPVLIMNCTGNLRIQDANGNTIGMVKDGYSQNWSALAQATVDKIKAAGALL